MAEKGKDINKDPEQGGADPTTAQDTAPAPGWLHKKKMILIAAVAVLLLVLGVPVYFWVRSHTHTTPTAAMFGQEEEFQKLVPEGSQEEDELDEDEEALGALFPLDTFVVNLAGGKNYLRCQVQVEFKERDVPKRFYVRLVPIRDGVIRILSSRTPSELMSHEGKEALKQALKEMMNDVLKKEEVKNIYFTQFVVQ